MGDLQLMFPNQSFFFSTRNYDFVPNPLLNVVHVLAAFMLSLESFTLYVISLKLQLYICIATDNTDTILGKNNSNAVIPS